MIETVVTFIACFTVQTGLIAGAALVAGRSVVMNVVLVAAAGYAAWIAPLAPFPRALMALLAVLATIKSYQISVSRTPWPWRMRLWHGLVPFDVRRTRRVPNAFSWTLLFKIVVFLGVALAMIPAVAYFLRLPPPASWLWIIASAAGLYLAIEAVADSFAFVHRLAGIEVPLVQRSPILSRSAAEFWGDRWNRTVSQWLHRLAYVPLARRGKPALGVLGAFAVSALFHAWVMGVGVGWWAAWWIALYFAIEGVVVLAEWRLGVRRWPSVLARAWTFVVLLVPSPLILWPVVRLVG